MGGAGFLPFSRIGPGAYFASVAVSRITDVRFASFDDFFKAGLRDFVCDAWSDIREFVLQQSTSAAATDVNMTRLESLTGPNPDSVWLPSFVSCFSKKPKQLPLIQKKITDLVMSISQSKSISDALETLSEAGAPAPRRREAAATHHHTIKI